MLLAPVPTEAEKVEAWRMEQLLVAGYPIVLALELATSSVDLHHAIDLVKRGCAPEVAYRILF